MSPHERFRVRNRFFVRLTNEGNTEHPHSKLRRISKLDLQVGDHSGDDWPLDLKSSYEEVRTRKILVNLTGSTCLRYRATRIVIQVFGFTQLIKFCHIMLAPTVRTHSLTVLFR